ncbi:DUF5694 domain-containing protein [Zhouia spongiae]|uniref:DUF5694 domain-containing protein n=1 Tax=Zhouia spongiae TaxID=2202721 RepID=A0ABY3YJM8_9FLAO|nr:DUF5694 domain-containing protein [Zhouia spongiae]UNY98055.1 DUF5694 domain-containing protein [Zhouia spongiae]
MKHLLSIILVVGLMSNLFAQDVNWELIEKTNADNILSKGTKSTDVLLLGTFHFNYPGLDDHKTAEEDKMDVLSVQRQQELNDVLMVLKRYNPTRIYVESENQAYHDSLYTAYVRGNFTLKRNEIYQLAYRLAKLLGHKKVYAVDAGSLNSDFGNKLNSEEQKAFKEKIFGKNSQLVNKELNDQWDGKYKQLYKANDIWSKEMTLLEIFIANARPENLRRAHGHYLTAGFNTENNLGPDGLAMWWYSRNLRIFNNILKTQPREEDRLLVLFGNGHMSILNECFKASPQFNVVSLERLVKD